MHHTKDKSQPLCFLMHDGYEGNIPLINDTVIWPNGCLTVLFSGWL
jgi:hypothetical protein